VTAIVFVALFAFLSTNVNAAAKPKPGHCGRNRAMAADRCLKTVVIFGDREFVPPTNHNELDNFCGRLFKSVRCVRRYGNECLKPFPRQIAATASRGMVKQVKKICTSHRNEFLEQMVCPVKIGMEPSNRCMDSMIAKIEWTRATVKQDDQIPAVCCGFQQLKKCIVDVIMDVCPKVTNATAAATYFVNILHGAIDDMLDMVCGPYGTIPMCEKRLPEIMDKFTDIQYKITEGKPDAIKPKAQSVLMPLIEMIAYN